ncbi:hypothetical protein BD410DRAFT_823370 [Rickenella mellea]|uniref:Cyanovirin-N domain-containing protein n=1 Tax=Rickenella mellea TaxID=50990 RepID=A0A4R5XF09_9AGAM|nr:hypothetical protein BD410DRAFT_823370 [Rickenella mellea]
MKFTSLLVSVAALVLATASIFAYPEKLVAAFRPPHHEATIPNCGSRRKGVTCALDDEVQLLGRQQKFMYLLESSSIYCQWKTQLPLSYSACLRLNSQGHISILKETKGATEYVDNECRWSRAENDGESQRGFGVDCNDTCGDQQPWNKPLEPYKNLSFNGRFAITILCKIQSDS